MPASPRVAGGTTVKGERRRTNLGSASAGKAVGGTTARGQVTSGTSDDDGEEARTQHQQPLTDRRCQLQLPCSCRRRRIDKDARSCLTQKKPHHPPATPQIERLRRDARRRRRDRRVSESSYTRPSDDCFGFDLCLLNPLLWCCHPDRAGPLPTLGEDEQRLAEAEAARDATVAKLGRASRDVDGLQREVESLRKECGEWEAKARSSRAEGQAA